VRRGGFGRRGALRVRFTRLSSSFQPDKVYAVVKPNRRCKGDTSRTEKVEFALPN